MQKANRIMMITVSILLTLVLFTSTALSGTLAKYSTSEEQIYDTARVAKWGVTVRAWVDDDDKIRLKNAKATVTTSSTDQAMVTIKGLSMKPGDDFSDVIHFEITGSPEVKTRVRINMSVAYPKNADGNYYYTLKVPQGVASLSKDTYFVPIGFTFGAKDSTNTYVNNYVANPWRYCETTNPGSSNLGLNNTEKAIANGAKARLDVTSDIASSSWYFEKIFSPTAEGTEITFHPKNASGKVYDGTNGTTRIDINTFDMGFAYPFEWPPSDTELQNNPNKYVNFDKTTYPYSVDQLDQVGIYLSERGDCKVTITYTITVTQVEE